jgi:threonine dehydratase
MKPVTPVPSLMPKITLAEIEKAAAFLSGKITRTPTRAMPSSYKIAGTELFLKLENEQLTGSFKIRGALNKMQSLTAEERERGVVLSSAGNHAQGVAYAARELGVKAHIVMPHTTPIVKINATRSYGANVILHGEFYDEAFAHAKELERSKGYIFVHAFEDPFVIAGQGTIGIEIMKAVPDLDSLVIPIGGGGLMSGIATAAKAINPKIRIIGVVSDQTQAVMNMKRGEAVVERKKRISTIAEGIAVKTPSKPVYDTYLSQLVDEVVAVDDNEIAQAIVILMEKAKTVTEGAGAAAFAAVHTRAGELKLGAKSCVVLSGGNIDFTVMAKVIERGLRQEHRLARMIVIVDDLPGNLNRITSVMAENRANILEVYHDRVSPELAMRETRIDLLIETASEVHIGEIKSALKEQGFKILEH